MHACVCARTGFVHAVPRTCASCCGCAQCVRVRGGARANPVVHVLGLCTLPWPCGAAHARLCVCHPCAPHARGCAARSPGGAVPLVHAHTCVHHPRACSAGGVVWPRARVCVTAARSRGGATLLVHGSVHGLHVVLAPVHVCTPCLGMLTPVHAHTSLVHVHEPCAPPRAPRCLQPPPCAPPWGASTHPAPPVPAERLRRHPPPGAPRRGVHGHVSLVGDFGAGGGDFGAE